MQRILAGLLALLCLAGCRADLIEVRVSAGDLAAALAGERVEVPFEATYETFGALDADERRDLEHLREIAERYLVIEDFEVANVGSSTTVEIEGMLPLVRRDELHRHVYALVVEKANEPGLDAFPYRLSLAAGERFAAMKKEMQGVNYMSAPDDVNPVRFRLRADGEGGMHVLAGGFSLDGASHGISVVSIPQGRSVSLTFKGGAYDAVGGTLLLSEP